MHPTPGVPQPKRAYMTPEERGQMRQYGLNVLMQAFSNTKFASKLPAVVERAEEDVYNRCNDQGTYRQVYQKKIESSKDGIKKLLDSQRPQLQKLAAHGAAAQHPHHQHPQQAQFPPAGMQHVLPQAPQHPQHPQARAPQLETEQVRAAVEASAAEQADDFTDFCGAFVAQPSMPLQQPSLQMAQPMYAPQQPQPQQQGLPYAPQNVAVAVQQQHSQQQQAGPGIVRPQAAATVAAAAAQQQQLHMAGKMAGISGPHTGQMGALQAMGTAQMGVSMAAARTAGAPAAFPQVGPGAPGVAPVPSTGVLGAPGVVAVDQAMVAGMYGGGVAVQPGVAAAQHGAGGMMALQGAQQQVAGMMGQLPPQQQQQHTGIGMPGAGGGGNTGGLSVGVGMMQQPPPQQQQQQQHQGAVHPHAHAGPVAPSAAAPQQQVAYGMPQQGQQQDMSSYAHLSQQQQQLLAQQQAVAAAHQHQHAQQQQQQQQQAAVQQQQQAAQMIARVASGGLPPQAATAAGTTVAAAVAAAASRKGPAVPMGPAAAAAQMARAPTVPGAGIPAVPQQPQQQQLQQPAPAAGMSAMGVGAAYGGLPAANAPGLSSQSGVMQAAAPAVPQTGMPSGPAAIPQAAAAAAPAATVPAAPAPGASAPTPGPAKGGSFVVIQPDVTPAQVEEYWRVLDGIKARQTLLRAQLERFTKAAEQGGAADAKTHRSKRVLADAYRRCTADPNSPEYATLPIGANSIKLLHIVLSSLESNAQSRARPQTAAGAQPGAPAAPKTPAGGADGAAASATGPGAPHDGATAAQPMATPPQVQPPPAAASAPQAQLSQAYPAGVASAVATAAAMPNKHEGGVGCAMVGMASSPPVAVPLPAAAANAGRAAPAAAVGLSAAVAALQNSKLRGVKHSLHRATQMKAVPDATMMQLHGKTALESELGVRAVVQGRDVKLERTGDSPSPAVDQVTRLLGLLAQPLPHATLRVHASRGAADVLNFDWDSLMPSLPAPACAQLTAAAAAATAAAAAAGSPCARIISVCRVSGVSYNDGGGNPDKPSEGAVMVAAARAASGANGLGAGSGGSRAGADGIAATAATAAALPELKRRREAMEAACQEAQEELGESVALRLMDGAEGEAAVLSGGDLEAEAWLLECEAAVALVRAGEDEPRGAVAAGPAGGAAGPPWKRLRICVPWDYPEAAPIPTFSSTDASYMHPYGRASRLHFQTALQSGQTPAQLSIRSLAKAWRDAVARVCGAVRAADAATAHAAATPGIAAV